jgi:hypothetical protein
MGKNALIMLMPGVDTTAHQKYRLFFSSAICVQLWLMA